MVHKRYKSFIIITNIRSSESNGSLTGRNNQRNRAWAASTREIAELARRQYYTIATIGNCIELNTFYIRIQDTVHINMVLIRNRILFIYPPWQTEYWTGIDQSTNKSWKQWVSSKFEVPLCQITWHGSMITQAYHEYIGSHEFYN